MTLIKMPVGLTVVFKFNILIEFLSFFFKEKYKIMCNISLFIKKKHSSDSISKLR